MGFVAAVLLLLSAYVLFDWGVLGQSPFGSSASASGGGSSGGGTTPGPTGGAPFSSSLFGFNAPFAGFGESISGIGAADQRGLTAIGGAGSIFAHDVDFAAPRFTQVKLPGPSKYCYTYLGDFFGQGYGHLLAFRAPNGGVFYLLHFNSVANLNVNTCYAGGTPIGYSGGAPGQDPGVTLPGPNGGSTGPHVPIVTDQKALAWLQFLQGGG